MRPTQEPSLGGGSDDIPDGPPAPGANTHTQTQGPRPSNPQAGPTHGGWGVTLGRDVGHPVQCRLGTSWQGGGSQQLSSCSLFWGLHHVVGLGASQLARATSGLCHLHIKWPGASNHPLHSV